MNHYDKYGPGTLRGSLLLFVTVALIVLTFGQVVGAGVIERPTATPTFDAVSHATQWSAQVTAWAADGWIVETATPRGASGQDPTQAERDLQLLPEVEDLQEGGHE